MTSTSPATTSIPTALADGIAEDPVAFVGTDLNLYRYISDALPVLEFEIAS